MKACKLAAKAHGNTRSLEAVWNFSWGGVPAHIPCLKQLNAEAGEKARDISAVILADKFKVLSFASFCPKEVPKPSPKDPVPDVVEDEASSSDASYLDDFEDGEGNGEHIVDLLTLARCTVLTCGSFADAKVHQVRVGDGGVSDLIPSVKNASNEDPKHRLKQQSCSASEHKPCTACQKSWPDYINTFFDCGRDP